MKIKTDGYDNALFPHFAGKTVVGWEIKNFKFTGFPEGSSKSVWFAEKFEADSALLFVESEIEALSYYSLFPEKLDDTWSMSTAGAWGTQTERMIQAALRKYPDLDLVLGFNKDDEGRKYCSQIRALAADMGIPGRKIRFEQPEYSDWNEDLIQKTTEQLSF